MKVDVLGAEYTIVLISATEDKRLSNIDGFCDESAREIRVDNYESDPDNPLRKANMDKHIKKNIRHELTHAFLFESGLAGNSPWAQNEELVAWIAIQGPKLWKAWQEANAV